MIVIKLCQAVLGEELLGEGLLLSARHFRGLDQLVKDVEVALDAELEANSALLEQVVDDGC